MDPDASEVGRQWLDRAHAVGRAQARHLWITLIAALFFFALRNSALVGQEVNVPIVDLKLDAQSMLAAGPAILALLVIAALGSMQAWGEALEHYAGVQWSAVADRLDLSPTVLDFALYTTRGWPPRLNGTVKFFGYPAFLVAVLVEALWLYQWLWFSSAPGRIFFAVSAAPLLLGGGALLVHLFWLRIKGLFSKQSSCDEPTGGPDPANQMSTTKSTLVVAQVALMAIATYRLLRLLPDWIGDVPPAYTGQYEGRLLFAIMILGIGAASLLVMSARARTPYGRLAYWGFIAIAASALLVQVVMGL